MGNVTMVTRRRNGGPEVTLGTRSGSPESIAAHLAEFELAFGGSVKDVTQTEVTIVTNIMSCVDTTIVTGTEDDMRIIAEMCAYHVIATQDCRDAIVSSAVDQMQALGIKMTPLNLHMFGPMFMGGNAIKATMLVAFGLTEPDHVEAVLARNLRFQDLGAAFEIVRKYGLPIEDALAMAD